MTLRVVFRRAAQREFEEAAVWYEERRPGLATQFRSEVDQAKAAENPLRFAPRYREIRCVRVRRFPYFVFFLAETERLVVLSVFHVRRSPSVWRLRA
jgi:plasmid stabilization system protein ParE